MPGVRVNNVGGHGGSQRATLWYLGDAEKPNPSETDTDQAGTAHGLEIDSLGLRDWDTVSIYTRFTS